MALSACAALAAAADAPNAAITTLAHAGEVACEPARPHFCANIHVACSGVSPVRTFSFRLRAGPAHGTIETEAAADADAAGIAASYRQARADWGSDREDVILHPHDGTGYVKMLADGTFIMRHHARGDAIMASGRCR